MVWVKEESKELNSFSGNVLLSPLQKVLWGEKHTNEKQLKISAGMQKKTHKVSYQILPV